MDTSTWKPWYRGRFTVAIETIEDTEKKLVLRAWITKWDEVFSVLQRGGSGLMIFGLVGVAMLIKIATPLALAAAIAAVIGGASNVVATRARGALRRAARKQKKRGQPLDLKWEHSGSEGYRQATCSTLHWAGRTIDAAKLLSVTLIDLPPHSDFRWAIMLHGDGGMFEPFPPYLGSEEEILPIAKKLAERCGVPLSIER